VLLVTVIAAAKRAQRAGIARLRAPSLGAIFLSASACQIMALNPTTLISQYGHTAWRVQDGAFIASPTSFAQTPDGYMWVGTKGGLYRFDGVTFASWSPPPGKQYPSGNAGIQSLYVAKDGSLWIGSASGLSHLANGTFTSISAPIAQVESIAEDRDGAIWIARVFMHSFTGPVCKISGDNEQCYGESSGIQSIAGVSAEADAQGRLWFGATGTLIEWDRSLIGEYRLPGVKTIDASRNIESLAIDADGTIWAGLDRPGPNNGLLQFANGNWRTFVAPGWNGASVEISALFLDRGHCLWVGTANRGLYRIHNGSVEHFGHEDGLSADSVLRIFQDREGGIWVATGEGVDHFRDLPILDYSNFKNLGPADIKSVFARRDGSIAVGSSRSFFSIRGSTIAPQKTQPGLPGTAALSLLEDHVGNLWITTKIGGLAVEVNGRSRTVLEGDATDSIICLAEDTDHAIWAEFSGTHPRLIRIEDFQVREEFKPPQLPAGFSVIADPQGGVWVSLFDGSLRHYQKGKWRTLSMDPLARRYGRVGGIFNMSMDQDGTLWGAASGGVVGYRNGSLQLLNGRNGLPCPVAYSIISDLQRNLWIQEQCGLVRVDHSELQRWWANPESNLTVSTFTATDGFRPGIPYGRPAATRDTDGKLWFQNESAVMTIDPGNLAGNIVAPPVHVEQVVADRKTYLTQSDLRLPARTRQLELDYSGLSFVVPSRVLFRYMLEGYDHQWQEPGTRRAAFYNDLRPGKYTFRVIACNDSGLWNTVGASLQITILPAYYQTNWFIALCGVTFLALLWGIYQFRLQRLQQEFAIGLEARVSERTRIARDLHDTLLQSFNALLLRLQTVANVLPGQPDEAKRRIDHAIDQASNAVTEGRDKVHELRSGGSATADLGQAISDFARELLGGSMLDSVPEVHVKVEGTPVSLDPIVRDEAYRIATEAIRNAIRHANARRIEVEIRYDEHRLRLRIGDDGTGIDPAVLDRDHKAGHWGLRGMRERAKLVGGELEVWSQVNSGTEIELEIPATSAYAKPASSRWPVLTRFRRQG